MTFDATTGEIDLPPCSRILVVEDDADIRESLAEILRAEGYEVAEAAHGREALEVLHRDALPDLIMLDLMMPVMDGWQLMARLKADPRLADIPVATMSAPSRQPPRRTPPSPQPPPDEPPPAVPDSAPVTPRGSVPPPAGGLHLVADPLGEEEEQ